MLRVSVFLALLAGASAAATGADSTCDTTLTLFYVSGGTACTASSGVCPSTCLAALEALDTDCAGKKYTLKETQNGKDVELALDWNTDKARYLILFQTAVNLGLSGSDDACNEVIHDYQLTHINDCNEAYNNVNWDVLFGYYCNEPKSTDSVCAPECQESIDKLESVCNPAGGPIGTYTSTADDDVTTIQETYSWANMAATGILGPDSCTYTTSLSSAGTLRSSVVAVAAAASISVAALLL